MQRVAGDLTVMVRANTSRFTREMMGVNKVLRRTANRHNQFEKAQQRATFANNDAGAAMEGYTKRMVLAVGVVDLLTMSVKALAAANLVLLGGAYAVTREYADFDSVMVATRSVAQANAAEYSALTDEVLAVSQASRKGAVEVAEGAKFLAMAGQDISTIQQTLSTTTKLAEVSFMEVGATADLATNMMAGFGMGAEEFGYAADVIASGSTKANTNVRQMANAFSYAGPLLAQNNVSIEESTAMIGSLANAGFQGEKGGTALRNMFMRLQNPTAETSRLIKAMGLEIKNSEGQMRPMVDILDDMVESGASAKVFMEVFGARAMPAAVSMINQGTDSVRDLTQELRYAGGTLDEMRRNQLDSLSGQMAVLDSTTETLVVTFGRELAPIAISLAKDLTGFMQTIIDNKVQMRLWVADGILFVAKSMTAVEMVAPVLAGAFSGLWAITEMFFMGIPRLLMLIVRSAAMAVVAIGDVTGAAIDAMNGREHDFKHTKAMWEDVKDSFDDLTPFDNVQEAYNNTAESIGGVTDSLYRAAVAQREYAAEQNALEHAQRSWMSNTAPEHVEHINKISTAYGDALRSVFLTERILAGMELDQSLNELDTIMQEGGRIPGAPPTTKTQLGDNDFDGPPKGSRPSYEREKLFGFKKMLDEAEKRTDRWMQLEEQKEREAEAAAKARTKRMVAFEKERVDAIIAEQKREKEAKLKAEKEFLELRQAMLDAAYGGLRQGVTDARAAQSRQREANTNADQLEYLKQKAALEEDAQERARIQQQIDQMQIDQTMAKRDAMWELADASISASEQIANALAVASDKQFDLNKSADQYVSLLGAVGSMGPAAFAAIGMGQRQAQIATGILNATLAATAAGLFFMTKNPSYMVAAITFASKAIGGVVGAIASKRAGSGFQTPIADAEKTAGDSRDQKEIMKQAFYEALEEAGLTEDTIKPIVNEYYLYDPVATNREEIQARKLRERGKKAKRQEVS